MSATATRLPTRKYKLRFIQSILQLERTPQSGDYAKGERAVFLVGDLAVGLGFLRVRVKEGAALQLLQHGISDPFVSVSLPRNVLQTHRAEGKGHRRDFVRVNSIRLLPGPPAIGTRASRRRGGV